MASLPLYHDQEGLEEADLSGYIPGQDDFYTLADYQIGDPLHRVAWKQLAKGQGMVSKQFSGQQQQSLWLKQPHPDNRDLERVLGQLCHMVLSLNQSNQLFGLQLGNELILPNRGSTHLEQCLTLLALYPSIPKASE